MRSVKRRGTKINDTTVFAALERQYNSAIAAAILVTHICDILSVNILPRVSKIACVVW